MKILLVDDDRDQLAIRRLLFEKNGFEALAAADVKAALRLAAHHCPVCCLMDLRLPSEEDGWQLIRQLKAVSGALRIWVLTGAPLRRLAQRPERELVEGIVQKGSPTADLLRKLRGAR